MSTAPKPFITPEQYLHREKSAEFRSEYFRGEMFAMAGASANHNLIIGNCIQTLGLQLKKRPFAQDRHSIDCFSRKSDGSWSLTGCQTMTGMVELDAIDVQLSAAEVYDKVILPALVD